MFNQHGGAAALVKQQLHPSDKQSTRNIWKGERKLFFHLKSSSFILDFHFVKRRPVLTKLSVLPGRLSLINLYSSV